MTRGPRRKPRSSLQDEGALAALKGDKTLTELAQQFDVHANQNAAHRPLLAEHVAQHALNIDATDFHIPTATTTTS